MIYLNSCIMCNVLPGVNCWVSNHDVSVEGDGEDVEHGDPQQPVPHQRVELAEVGAPDPPPGQEHGGSQGEVEAAEEQV